MTLASEQKKCYTIIDSAPRIALRCSCGECKLPFAYLVLTTHGYALQIVSEHDHAKHLNLVPFVIVQGE